MTDTLNTTRQLGAAVYQSLKLDRTGLQESVFARLFARLVYAQIWEELSTPSLVPGRSERGRHGA